MADLESVLVGAGVTAVGAGIGGAITAWVTLRAEDKRQAFAREVEEDRSERETRDRVADLLVSVRAVHDELIRVQARLRGAVENGVLDAELPREAWHAHSPALARVMSHEPWLKLSGLNATLLLANEEIREAGKITGDVLQTHLDDATDGDKHLLPYVAGAAFGLPVLPPLKSDDEDASG